MRITGQQTVLPLLPWILLLCCTAFIAAQRDSLTSNHGSAALEQQGSVPHASASIHDSRQRVSCNGRQQRQGEESRFKGGGSHDRVGRDMPVAREGGEERVPHTRVADVPRIKVARESEVVGKLKSALVEQAQQDSREREAAGCERENSAESDSQHLLERAANAYKPGWKGTDESERRAGRQTPELTRAITAAAGGASEKSETSIARVFRKMLAALSGSTRLKDAKVVDDTATRTPGWPELDMDLAMALGRLDIVTYCNDLDAMLTWNCTRCADVKGFKPNAVVFDANKDVLGMTGWSEAFGAKIVAFRGTNSRDIWNWVEDMKAWRIDFQIPIPGADGAKIHDGFWNLWAGSTLSDNITSAYEELMKEHPDGPTYILGHSMGGALAQLCALWLKANFRGSPAMEDLRLVTWGSPRVGNLQYAQLVVNETSGHWRFTHSRDIVPSVPTQYLGYQHTPQEMWLIEITVGQQVLSYVIECNMSGEDPLCHNSVCHLGICTSVSDHLDYMGLNFYSDALEC